MKPAPPVIRIGLGSIACGDPFLQSCRSAWGRFAHGYRLAPATSAQHGRQDEHTFAGSRWQQPHWKRDRGRWSDCYQTLPHINPTKLGASGRGGEGMAWITRPLRLTCVRGGEHPGRHRRCRQLRQSSFVQGLDAIISDSLGEFDTPPWADERRARRLPRARRGYCLGVRYPCRQGRPATSREAIFVANPTTRMRFAEPLPDRRVTVRRGPALDGVGKLHGRTEIPVWQDTPEVDVAAELRRSGTEILVSYLPVGSQLASRILCRAGARWPVVPMSTASRYSLASEPRLGARALPNAACRSSATTSRARSVPPSCTAPW